MAAAASEHGQPRSGDDHRHGAAPEQGVFGGEKRRLDRDQGHAAVAPWLRGALIYQVHRLAAGAVPPGRRWGVLGADSCSALMCVWAV